MELTVGKLREMLKDVRDDMVVVGWSDYYPGNETVESSGVQTGVHEDADKTEYFVINGMF